MRPKSFIKNLRIFFLVVCSLACSAAQTQEVPQDEPPSITVLASTSLTDVMSELVRMYSKDYNVTVSVVFGSPEDLAFYITEGESADIYISESHENMVMLRQQGLIDVYSISRIAANSLVLVAPKEHYLTRITRPGTPLVAILKDINERAILAMGDPDTVEIGKVAKAILEKLGYWEQVKSFIIRSGTDREALYLMVEGKYAGVTYLSDALMNPSLQILAEFPRNLYEPIIYQGAVVAGLQMPFARKFLDFLKTPQAMAVFKNYGFLPVAE